MSQHRLSKVETKPFLHAVQHPLSAVLLFMFVLIVPSPSLADFISFQDTFTSRYSYYYQDSGNRGTVDFVIVNKPLQDTWIDRFDPQLGTLNRVTIEFRATYAQPTFMAAVFRDNNWYSNVSGQMALPNTPQFWITIGGDSGLFPDVTASTRYYYQWEDQGSSYSSASECSVRWDLPQTASGDLYNKSLDLTGSDMSPFVGTGQWQMSSNWGFRTLVPTVKVLDPYGHDYIKEWGMLLSLEGDLGVTYDYTPHPSTPDPEPAPEPSPVPVPSSCLLLSAGMACLARRRRSMKSEG